jgi:hypothetical protein
VVGAVVVVMALYLRLMFVVVLLVAIMLYLVMSE